MHLHFLIPGLLWPNEHYKAAMKQARLPALATLIGRGKLTWQPPLAQEVWLARHFGLSHQPYAALRLAGEADSPAVGTQHWLCADPVQLSFTQQGPMLADAGSLELSMAEVEALLASLNQEFADLGQFHAAAPERWYLRLLQPAAINSHRLSEVVGRRVDRFLPSGPQATLWHRYFNEIQVFLHNHPVNLAREKAGRPRLNSLWFWGEGALPEAPASRPAFDTVITDDILARGLAKQAGIPPQASSVGYAAVNGSTNLVLLDKLQRHLLYSELDAWLDALQAFDSQWLAPALAALKSGRLKTLSLTAPGDRASLSLELGRADHWKFWRAPRPYPTLEIPDLATEALQ